jgi:hypothetical protein
MFFDMLDKIIYPTQNQKEKELWDISGIIKGKSNQEFKFDLRPLKKLTTGENVKEGSFLTKADKMVFETTSEWIIVDIEELHSYLKKYQLKTIQLEELILSLDWNIILPKK